MSNEFSRLRLTESNSIENNCLNSYLEADLFRVKKILPGNKAERDNQLFREGIENLVELLDSFINEEANSISILALGKIQSGKTAHMLGVLSWAVDTQISLATIFTGLNGDLNNQTVARLNNSLGSLNTDFIRVFLVPTSHTGKDFDDLKKSLDEIIIKRISRGAERNTIPLPVLATLKTIQRINTLEVLHTYLSQTYGGDLISMLLDDEADQASQTSGASKGEITKIYEAISNVRKSLVRNIYLAYTATPQAILLTEKYGYLRPDYSVLVPPRTGYFGLEDAMATDFAKNLVEIYDWDGTSVSITEIPQSLKDAMHEYFWSSTIRFLYPNIFFTESELPDSALDNYLKSTQMMIHESSRVAFHKAMYRFVASELESYKSDLISFISGEMTAESRENFSKLLDTSWDRFRKRVGKDISQKLPGYINPDMTNKLLEVTTDTEIVVVNGDKTRPNNGVDFPVEDKDWETHKSWICIGGDILGRGLTLPQLITTYFLRTSKVPNFDTVSQQMRFCGYRKGFESFTSIWAEERTFLSFRYMKEIESVVWNRAKTWDEERIQINKEIPRVLYASPVSSRMEPTRKSVRDPSLIDSKVKGEIVFSAAKIMQPHIFRLNFSFIRSWITDQENHLVKIPNWYLLQDISNSDIYSLLDGWACDPSEKARLLGTMELFAADMEALGLANVPRACFISRDILEYPPLRDLRDMKDLALKTKFYRTTSGVNQPLSFNDWANGVTRNLTDTPFKAVSVTHIGGTLRKLKEKLQFDSTVFIIEFMRGIQGKGIDAKTISLGITLTILSPDNYEVRTIGHA